MMTAELPKSYTPGSCESEIRRQWDDAGAFHATADAPGEPYCIVIPPPNVTAPLHLGHAFNNTLQDVLIRYHRMQGRNVLWMPGTDHAGIATQTVVEKRLLQQGTRRTELGREKFVERVQEWKDEYEATIIEQLKAIGCSCDWDRTRFTMDAMCAKAVREAFFRLFKDGLIYRGKRLVNWDPVTLTALADDEVEMKEVPGHMWYLRYPIVDAGSERSEGPDYITVATTRPETMLGDTAVAVNMKDPRAEALRGKSVRLPIVDRVIPIIEDPFVVLSKDMGGDPSDAKAEFATGFLKVTPAHDPNDYEIGLRHKTAMGEHWLINILAPDASISTEHGWGDCNDEARQFVGMTREDARKAIVKWFKDHDLLEDIRDYSHSVGHSYRSHVPIEPYLSDQWYVKVTDDSWSGEALRALSKEQYEGNKPQRATSSPTVATHESKEAQGTSEGAAVEDDAARIGDNELTFYPARYAKTYQAWHENIRDWCISRQLWWGHRIPVWSISCTSAAETTKAFHVLDIHPQDTLEEMLDGTSKTCALRITDVESGRELQPSLTEFNHGLGGAHVTIHFTALDGNEHVTAGLEDHGFTQDPDVLDTWFSSGLWPISTMGWPDPEAYPETKGLLDTFNPSTVLITGRDIITLWVSRMVMFNRYLRDGVMPYRDVYINPMIQDGHGQRMSKSLGNGVDPRDIIHSHGADALRYVMCELATSTQDVRLPVDMICPHCEHEFDPKQITSPAGYKVAAPEQQCPKCGKTLISAYGIAAGIAQPSDDTPLARNSSRDFDKGRNFANKLWNAVRFALGNLTVGEVQTPPREEWEEKLCLADRWIITRLHRTLHRIEEAVGNYQFNIYAEAMFDFVRRDFCDWYLEAIKPTVKEDPVQQQVLRTVLNATLRLLHPVCPFVTEALWPHVQAAGGARLDGIDLPDSELLATAPWPDIACSVDDAEAAEMFEQARRLTESIRTIRGEKKVKPRQKINLEVTAPILPIIEAANGLVETIAGLESVRITDEHPADAIPVTFEGEHLFLSGLTEAVNVEDERIRLKKTAEELKNAIDGYRNRLQNENYVKKAPPHLVDETKQQLARAEADLAAAKKALKALKS